MVSERRSATSRSAPPPRPPRKPPARDWPRSLFARIVLWGSIGSTLAAIAIAWLFYHELDKQLPPVEQLANYQPSIASQVLARDGTVIGEFYFEKRYLIALGEIPKIVRDAFIAAEDSAFYSHRGIDLWGMTRAAFSNLIAGEVVQGGSTITQQVVKALLLTPTKSYERKLKEVILSLRLERQLTKDEILYLYLNQIYLGSGAYGVDAAAQEYFGKSIRAVTVAEASLLAGLPQAPSRYSPIRHPERARARQRYALTRMREEGFLTSAEYQDAISTPVRVVRRRMPTYRFAPDYVEHVRRELLDRYGERAPYQAGLQIRTAIDLDLQAKAEKALVRGLKDLDRRRGYRGPIRTLAGEEIQSFLNGQEREIDTRRLAVGASLEAVVMGTSKERVTLLAGTRAAVLAANQIDWADGWSPGRFKVGDVLLVRIVAMSLGEPLEVSLDQHPEVEGAFLAMDVDTGLVRAMVGGYDYKRSEFNRATQALRQPGSSFKPFIYAAAFDRGYTPASVVVDAPVVYDDWKNPWKPGNYDDKWRGPTRLRDALTFSRNVISVKLADAIGLNYLIKYLPSFGFARPFPRNLSISLGTSEVTLLEIVRAYGVFAAQGKLREPIFITDITDRAGNVLEHRSPTAKEAISPETAYLLTSVMQDVIRRGTGKRAELQGRPAAGKTGTTNEEMDAWFVGYTPEIVAGVWVGFDEKKPLGKKETGGRAAAPIWQEFMEGALEGRPVSEFEVPDGISFVNIDRASGHRASAGDATILECFRKGGEPRQFASRPEAVQPTDFFRGDF